MNNFNLSTNQPVDTIRDRRAALKEILRLNDEVLGEPGAETSIYYHRHISLERIATLLSQILDGGGFDAYFDDYLQRARSDLRKAFRLEPYDDGDAS